MELIVAFLIVLAISIPSYIWYGYVVSILWGWFMVGTFNLPALSIPAAIGLALVVHLLRGYTYEPDKKTTAEKMTSIAMSFIYPLISLGIGWIVKNFI